MGGRRGRSRRRRSPELRAALDELKREVGQNLAARRRRPGPDRSPAPGGNAPGGDGPMVDRLIELAERHLARRRAGIPPGAGDDGDGSR